MREAAFKAGLIEKKDSDRLILALEPEAAALFCKQMPDGTLGSKEESSVWLELGEKYLVIDAGGGNMDITG
jgi:hypothetical protein